MPSSHLPVAKTDALPQVSVDSCLLQVLKWNPNWLREYGMLYSGAFYIVYIFVELFFQAEKFLGNSKT